MRRGNPTAKAVSKMYLPAATGWMSKRQKAQSQEVKFNSINTILHIDNWYSDSNSDTDQFV